MISFENEDSIILYAKLLMRGARIVFKSANPIPESLVRNVLKYDERLFERETCLYLTERQSENDTHE